MLKIVAGLWLGWALGANDAANIFGTAVGTKMVKYWTAAVLTSLFVLLGAFLEGMRGIETLGAVSSQTAESAFTTALAAAVTVTIMTYLKLPVSTSQAMVGAILGNALFKKSVDFKPLVKIVLAWFFTPLGAGVIALIIFYLIKKYLVKVAGEQVQREKIIRWGLITAGSFCAYALGANNVANVTGVYVGSGLLTLQQGSLLGGLFIASGVLTYSRNVMSTIGEEITRLTAQDALVAVLAEGFTVYIYARLGIPVSTSQAIVGAIVGIGLAHGINYLNKKTVIIIFFGWVGTPTVAGVISLLFSTAL